MLSGSALGDQAEPAGAVERPADGEAPAPAGPGGRRGARVEEPQQVIAVQAIDAFVAVGPPENPEYAIPLVFGTWGTGRTKDAAGKIPLDQVFDRADTAHGCPPYASTEAHTRVADRIEDGSGLNLQRRSVGPCPTSAGTLGRLITYRLRASWKLPILSDLDCSDALMRAAEIELRAQLVEVALRRRREQEREVREALFAATNTRHGTRSRYAAGCRCAACKAAYWSMRAVVNEAVRTGPRGDP